MAKNWLTEFGELMGGATETVQGVVDTINKITNKQTAYLPVSVPEILRQMEEQKDVQGEVKTPAATSFADSPWLPAAVLGVLIILMVR